MDEPSLQDYIAVLRRRRRVVALAVIVAVAIALGLSLLMTPTYRARSELLLQRTANEEILVDELGQARSGADAERELNDEIELIESQAVRDAVAEKYDGPLDVDDVTASASASDSNSVVNVDVSATKPAAAAELANLYVDTYTDFRRERRLDELLSASEEIQSRLDALRQQIAEVSQAARRDRCPRRRHPGRHPRAHGARGSASGGAGPGPARAGAAAEPRELVPRAALTARAQPGSHAARWCRGAVRGPRAGVAGVSQAGHEPGGRRAGRAVGRHPPRLRHRSPRRLGAIEGDGREDHRPPDARGHPQVRQRLDVDRPGRDRGPVVPRDRGVPPPAHVGAVPGPGRAAPHAARHQCRRVGGQDGDGRQPVDRPGPGRRAGAARRGRSPPTAGAPAVRRAADPRPHVRAPRRDDRRVDCVRDRGGSRPPPHAARADAPEPRGAARLAAGRRSSSTRWRSGTTG